MRCGAQEQQFASLASQVRSKRGAAASQPSVRGLRDECGVRGAAVGEPDGEPGAPAREPHAQPGHPPAAPRHRRLRPPAGQQRGRRRRGRGRA
eukprot:1473160-Rhodomonas_salina.2